MTTSEWDSLEFISEVINLATYHKLTTGKELSSIMRESWRAMRRQQIKIKEEGWSWPCGYDDYQYEICAHLGRNFMIQAYALTIVRTGKMPKKMEKMMQELACKCEEEEAI